MSGVEGPHQPKKYSFPYRSFGTKGENRCFKGVWFQQWLWLDYKELHTASTVFHHQASHQDNLRSTMLQERLNSVMVMHVHHDFTDTLNLKAQKVTIENINS